MQSVTKKTIEAQIERLNRETNNPLTPYVRDGEKFTAQLGNYHLSGAYGG